jgi:hypothetical protein
MLLETKYISQTKTKSLLRKQDISLKNKAQKTKNLHYVILN